MIEEILHHLDMNHDTTAVGYVFWNYHDLR